MTVVFFFSPSTAPLQPTSLPPAYAARLSERLVYMGRMFEPLVPMSRLTVRRFVPLDTENIDCIWKRSPFLRRDVSLDEDEHIILQKNKADFSRSLLFEYNEIFKKTSSRKVDFLSL